MNQLNALFLSGLLAVACGFGCSPNSGNGNAASDTGAATTDDSALDAGMSDSETAADGELDASCREYPPVEPDQTAVAGRLERSPEVDGRLDEAVYESLPVLEVTDAAGESENAVRLQAGWTAETLHFGIAVDDSNIERDDGVPLHQNDGIELFFDLEQDGGSDLSADDHQWLIPAQGEPRTKRGSAGEDEPETSLPLEIARSVRDDGYVIELAVPLDALEIDPSADDSIGFLVANNDRDSGAHTAFAWRDVDPFKQPGEWGALAFVEPNCGDDVGEVDTGTDGMDTDTGGMDADAPPGIRHDRYDGPIGGGNGMPRDLVVSQSDADEVVSSMSELQTAVDGASSGDVLYVSGEISGSLTVETAGVTVAGNRGFGDDGRWTDASLDQNAPDLTLSGLSIDAGGGEFANVDSTGLEVFNCLVENSSSGSGAFDWETGDSGATFSHSTFRDWGYYGVQVAYNWHSRDQKITIQYNVFEDLGQHMIQGGYGWFLVRDNHFRGTLNHSNDHVLEVRGGSDAPVSCGVDAGNAIVEHNLHEASGSDGKAGLVRVRGVPTDGVWVEDNRAPGNGSATGGCHERGTHGGWGDQIVMQNASSTDDLENVHLDGNVRQ